MWHQPGDLLICPAEPITPISNHPAGRNQAGLAVEVSSLPLSPRRIPTISNSLTEIARYSFYGYTALKTIKFSENATLATIGDYGFYDCPMLHTVDMSNCNQVTRIGASAFQSSDEMRHFKIGTVVPPTCGSTPFGAVGNYSVLKVPDGAVTQYQSASGWKDFASITSLNE